MTTVHAHPDAEAEVGGAIFKPLSGVEATG